VNDSARIDLIGMFSVSTSHGLSRVQRTSLKLFPFLSRCSTPEPRSELASALWPNDSEHSARGYFRSAVRRLAPVGSRLLDSGDEALCVCPGTVFDITRLRRRWTAMPRAIRIDDEVGQDSKLHADLLPNLTEVWVEPSRLRWRQRCLRVVGRYSHELRTQPCATDAVVVLEREIVGAPRLERLRATASSVATGRRRVVKRTTRRQTWRTKSVANPRAAGTGEVHHAKETSR
jgi:DNA-binding SARP family transcriptional activator